MQVSVIIPSYNRAGALELTLAGLADQTLTPTCFEVIVVDDGSTDQSIEMVAEARVPYSLHLVQQENKGAGAARNRGTQGARADLYVFLDVDVVASPQLLEEYLNAEERHPGTLIVGRQQPWPDAYHSPLDHVTRHEWFRDLGPGPVSLAFYNVLSSNMSIHSDGYRGLGGFDEGVGTGTHPATDDTDFGYRAQRQGMELVYWPGALGYHNHPRTLEQRCTQARTIAFWTAKMYQRYPEMSGSIPIFRDVEPIAWGSDSLPLVTRKFRKGVLGTSPMPDLVKLALRLALWGTTDSRLIRFLYWRTLSAYRVAGFRAGSGLREACA